MAVVIRAPAVETPTMTISYEASYLEYHAFVPLTIEVKPMRREAMPPRTWAPPADMTAALLHGKVASIVFPQ